MQAAERYLASGKSAKSSNTSMSLSVDYGYGSVSSSSDTNASPSYNGRLEIELDGKQGPQRRAQRRSSASSSRRSSTSSMGYYKQSDDDLEESLHSYAGDNGSADDEEQHLKEPSFMKALRRGSLSKDESEIKLKQSLSKVSDYVDPHDDDRIQLMKERISLSKQLQNVAGTPKKREQRFGRRSSIESTSSSMCSSFAPDTPTRTHSGSLLESLQISSAELTGIASSVRHSDLSSFNMSTSTIPVTNAVRTDEGRRRKHVVKTDQIVESLVWFSFHTPRTVLEDLIKHEMEIWRRQSLQPRRGNSLPTESALGKSLLTPLDDEMDDHSLSSLSEDGNARVTPEPGDKTFSQTLQRMKQDTRYGKFDMIKLPKAVERESALLFVDMSGFTKLSTMLDVESLSRVINSYFDMILSEVILHGGDILKFAGDAFFAEWKVLREEGCDAEKAETTNNPLADLNASLASINEMAWHDDIDLPKLSTCVLSAAKCATAIVAKFSDYQVTSGSAGATGAMLNVHCGIGVGQLVGLHVGDYKENQEEDGVELRREFLILGEAIDQVSIAADVATDGQVMASPEAMLHLAFCCDMPDSAHNSTDPVCIASRGQAFLQFDSDFQVDGQLPSALLPYESLRLHCRTLNHEALARLHLQMALYVHPVIRADELALSTAIQAGKISQPTEALESRHRAEAELRSVFTIFIKPIVLPRVTGMREVDEELFKTLADIMHITSRELDRYSGHLRQFIVDDKGVVLLATFGLRGSTFPNMVANNALPATFAIHRALKTEINVESRIGATFGKVYCGVVGGVRRHEFAVMGAPVNLAARLMSSKVNNGILVDEAVKEQAGANFAFRSLPPVQAKGYDKPVPILEPLHAVNVGKKKKVSYPFVGRRTEKEKILSITSAMYSGIPSSAMIFLMGESGTGKSSLSTVVIDEIKKRCVISSKTIVSARSTSTETEQRIPLSAYRKILLSIIRDLCEHDGTCEDWCGESPGFDNRSHQSVSSKSSFAGIPLTSLKALYAMRGSSRSGLKNRDFATTSQGEGDYRASIMRSRGLREISDSEEASVESSVRSESSEQSPKRVSQSLRILGEALANGTTRPTKKDFLAPNLNISLHRATSRPTKGDFLPSNLSASVHNSMDASRHKSKREPLSNSLHRITSEEPKLSSKTRLGRDDTSIASGENSTHKHGVAVPYFEKLCWVCEKLDYPYEYADLVGSQFLSLDGASPVTHVDGHVPTMDELVEFLALAFICITEYADISVILIDDFQWADSFSWKIFRELCQRGNKLLLICAMRSHDKQALRRLSTAVTQRSQLHSKMTEISLTSLDTDDIRELMAHVLGHKEELIPESLCTDVFQRTGGLPVFVIQVLENIKRAKTVELGEDGRLQWNAAGLKEKRAIGSNKAGAVMEETFLSRFDGLDVQVRKVLQTCAVLGLTFSFADVVQVHPEMEEADIEYAMCSAVDEMVLVEQNDEDEERTLISAASNGDFDDSISNFLAASRASTSGKTHDERFFQFSHAMWRKSVLTTMLKERKIEIHRLIAEAMETDKVLILEESDITRLLTLFDHWKSCGDFSKSAPLALVVGARLEEWDLSAQSLELYEDALSMAFDSVETHEDMEAINDEWVQVSARPIVLDLILRLHIRIGLCHQRLGDESESIATFEDAFNIMNTSSKFPGISRSLMMPIISSLCVLKLEHDVQDSEGKEEQEQLLQQFLCEATINGNPVHIGRVLALQAMYHAKTGSLDRALDDVHLLQKKYDIQENSFDMITEYGRDFALECFSESVQWIYLLEKHDAASDRVDLIMDQYLTLIDPIDGESMMAILLPILNVLKLLNRATDADWLLKRYIINPAHDQAFHCEFWVPLFNPLAYLLEVVVMEESEDFDEQVLQEMELWVLEEENSKFDFDLEYKAHTLMGELCWRLANFKEENNPTRGPLIDKARDFLTPVAQYPHGEVFLRNTAQALLEVL